MIAGAGVGGLAPGAASVQHARTAEDDYPLHDPGRDQRRTARRRPAIIYKNVKRHLSQARACAVAPTATYRE